MVVEKNLNDEILLNLKKFFNSSNNVKKPFTSVGLRSCILEMTSSPVLDNNMLGSNDIENALIRQWLEYAALYGPFVNKSSLVAKQVLLELNRVLSRQLFLVRNNKTVADIVLFFILWNVVASLTLQEKELFLNLSRWFSTLQQDEKLRQSRKLICFSRTLLY